MKINYYIENITDMTTNEIVLPAHKWLKEVALVLQEERNCRNLILYLVSIKIPD